MAVGRRVLILSKSTEGSKLWTIRGRRQTSVEVSSVAPFVRLPPGAPN